MRRRLGWVTSAEPIHGGDSGCHRLGGGRHPVGRASRVPVRLTRNGPAALPGLVGRAGSAGRGRRPHCGGRGRRFCGGRGCSGSRHHAEDGRRAGQRRDEVTGGAGVGHGHSVPRRADQCRADGFPVDDTPLVHRADSSRARSASFVGRGAQCRHAVARAIRQRGFARLTAQPPSARAEREVSEEQGLALRPAWWATGWWRAAGRPRGGCGGTRGRPGSTSRPGRRRACGRRPGGPAGG